jgi:hypothetical protein
MRGSQCRSLDIPHRLLPQPISSSTLSASPHNPHPSATISPLPTSTITQGKKPLQDTPLPQSPNQNSKKPKHSHQLLQQHQSTN